MSISRHTDLIDIFPKEHEQKLRAIRRYSMFEVFFYRPMLWHHSIRVFYIVDELLKLADQLGLQDVLGYDGDKARVMAFVHDDAEMITGDVQLGHKLVMKREELEKVAQDEERGIEKLAEHYPKEVAGYSYKDLLLAMSRKDTVESMLVSYADKLDAYCESLHEVLGGNISALRAVMAYVGVLRDFEGKYPALKPLFACRTSPLTRPDMFLDTWKVHRENNIFLNTPHTKETLKKETEFVIYNFWRKLVLEKLGQEGERILLDQVERF